jgi:hypothetical protein
MSNFIAFVQHLASNTMALNYPSVRTGQDLNYYTNGSATKINALYCIFQLVLHGSEGYSYLVETSPRTYT